MAQEGGLTRSYVVPWTWPGGPETFLLVILLAVLLLALALVPVTGGSLVRLADIHLRWVWAIAIALGLQVVIISVFPDRFEFLQVPFHFLSYGFAALFVWANRRIPGMVIIAVGALSNLIAIAANGGVMPATAGALRAAGLQVKTGEFENSTVVEDPKLQFLGDVFAVPDSVPIIDNVFSVGDILIAIGIFVLIHGVCGSKLVPDRFRGSFAQASS